ncbi:hypothetical protein RSAG8_07597, partial [Rhizoctonia solani AG-8 WAC10335]
MGYQLPIVGFDEWNNRIVVAAESFKGSKADRYRRFPIINIRTMLDSAVRSDNALRSREDAGNADFGGVVRLDTTVAKALSKTLRSTSELGTKHVERWFGYWESRGLFEPV